MSVVRDLSQMMTNLVLFLATWCVDAIFDPILRIFLPFAFHFFLNLQDRQRQKKSMTGAKGQLISKRPFGVIILTNNFFKD